MGLFSVIYIMFLMHSYLKENKKETYMSLLIYTVVIEVIDFRGSLILITDGLSISAKLFSEIVLCMYGMYYAYKTNIKVRQALIYGWIVCIVLCFISIVGECIDPYDHLVLGVKESWDEYADHLIIKSKLNLDYGWIAFVLFKFSISIMSICMMKTLIAEKEMFVIINKTIKYLSFGVYYVTFEAFCKLFLANNDITNFMSVMLFGVGDSSEIRGGSVSLIGLSTEPSSVARLLFVFVILMLISNKIIDRNDYDVKKNYRYKYTRFILPFILMLLTKSFLSIWLILMMACVFVVLKYDLWKMKRVQILKFICSFIIIGLFSTYVAEYLMNDDSSYLGQRLSQTVYTVDFLLNQNTISINSVDSSLPRLQSIYDAFVDFSNRPLLGMGMGVLQSHGGLASLLVDMGLLGMIAFFKFIFIGAKINTKYDIVFIYMYIMLVNLPVKVGNIPYEIYPFLLFEITKLYCGEKKNA